MAEVETSPQWAQMASGRDERVIYYRRKNGWITWGDSQASKLLVKIQKGATPLAQYGEIKDSKDLWGPILRAGGAHEFPVEQVLTYRWYKDCPVKGVRFPQLAGVKIIEFPCPECAREFHSPLHLGSHLRVMHGYDRSEVLKYGEAMNIDFSKVPGGKEVVSYDFAEAQEAAAEVIHDAEYEVSTVSAGTPASVEVAAEFEVSTTRNKVACPDCGKEVKPKGLKMHQTQYCTKQAVPA